MNEASLSNTIASYDKVNCSIDSLCKKASKTGHEQQKKVC